MDSIRRAATTSQQHQVKPKKYDWLRKLYKTDDLEIQRTCGTDAALYLVYLKYSAILFFFSKIIVRVILIVAICSNSVLLPLFATSSRED